VDETGLCLCPLGARWKHLPGTRDGCVYAREWVPAAVAEPGDTVLVRGQLTTVTAVDLYQPDEHDGVRVRRGMVARRVITDAGDRWFGHFPGATYRGRECRGYHNGNGVRFDG